MPPVVGINTKTLLNNYGKDTEKYRLEKFETVCKLSVKN